MANADDAEARLELFERSWVWQHGEQPGEDGFIADAIIPEGGYAQLTWQDVKAIREDRKRLAEELGRAVDMLESIPFFRSDEEQDRLAEQATATLTETDLRVDTADWGVSGERAIMLEHAPTGIRVHGNVQPGGSYLEVKAQLVEKLSGLVAERLAAERDEALVELASLTAPTEYRDSGESIYDVLERAPEPPETIVIPAQMMADVQCLGCGMLLVTAATRVGMNSKQNVGPHLCGGEFIPAFQLTVRTQPARTMLAPTADLDDPRQADG